MSDSPQLVTVIDNRPMTTSLKVAEYFRKTHRDVLEAIRDLDCSQEFSQRNFPQSEFTNARGRTYPLYHITRDGFAFLCMGFTGSAAAQWKEKYIAAFNQMEESLLSQSEDKPMSVLADYEHALALMQKDKDVASHAGSTLVEWRKVRKQHIQSTRKLLDEVQMKLSFWLPATEVE
jgi:Rha family phage regulatory protein